jgi:hypothetical protein
VPNPTVFTECIHRSDLGTRSAELGTGALYGPPDPNMAPGLQKLGSKNFAFKKRMQKIFLIRVAATKSFIVRW